VEQFKFFNGHIIQSASKPKQKFKASASVRNTDGRKGRDSHLKNQRRLRCISDNPQAVQQAACAPNVGSHEPTVASLLTPDTTCEARIACSLCRARGAEYMLCNYKQQGIEQAGKIKHIKNP
jgi:hypothetical protein